MSDITYLDKTDNPGEPLNSPKRKWRAVDANEVKSAVNSKVDKIDGYALSENNYSDEDRAKVADLPEDVGDAIAGKLDKDLTAGWFFLGTAENVAEPMFLTGSGSLSLAGQLSIDVGSGEDFITGRLPYMNMQQASGLSVLGIAGNVTGDFAPITSSSDAAVLIQRGTALVFDNLVSGDMPFYVGLNDDADYASTFVSVVDGDEALVKMGSAAGGFFSVSASLATGGDFYLSHSIDNGDTTITGRVYTDLDYNIGNYALLGGATFTGAVMLNADATSALQAVTFQQLQAFVTGLWDDRGAYTPAGSYPTANGSGTAGAILKGDIYTISGLGPGVTALMGTVTVKDGDNVRALVNTPGQTNSNWAVQEGDLGYTPLANTLASARIFVGSAGNIATAVSLSGAGTITNAGVLSVNLSAGATITNLLPVANGGLNNGTWSSGQIPYYQTSGTQFVGSANFTYASGAIQLGSVGGSIGALNMLTTTSGRSAQITPATSGSNAMNFRLPPDGGTAGHVLKTDAGGTNVNMSWGQVDLTIGVSGILPNANLPQSIGTTSNVQFGSGTFTGNLLPGTTATYDLGITGTRWRDLYISRSAVIGATLEVYESNLTTAHRLSVTANTNGVLLNATRGSGNTSTIVFQLDGVQVGAFNSSSNLSVVNSISAGNNLSVTNNVGIGVAPSTSSRIYLLNANTAQTATNYILRAENTGNTFNTTAGSIVNYGAYFVNSATRSSGGNDLINVGLYATANGGQANYAAILVGNVGININNPSTYNLTIGTNASPGSIGLAGSTSGYIGMTAESDGSGLVLNGSIRTVAPDTGLDAAVAFGGVVTEVNTGTDLTRHWIIRTPEGLIRVAVLAD